MKQDIKNNDLQERQAYVPASVKVIELSTRAMLCASPLPNGTDPYERETW